MKFEATDDGYGLAQEPVSWAKPANWLEIARSPEYLQAAPEKRLEILSDHADHYANYITQQGKPREEAQARAREFFESWRGNAIDNGVNPVRSAVSSFALGGAGLFWDSVRGAGELIENEARAKAPERVGEQTQKAIAAEYRAAKDDFARAQLAIKYDYKHGISVREEDGEVIVEPLKENGVRLVERTLAENVGKYLSAFGEYGQKDLDTAEAKWLRTNPRYVESFLLGKLPSGAGNALGFITVGRLAGPRGMAVAGAAAGAEAARQSAEAQGANEFQTERSMKLQALVGMSEAFGLGSGTATKLLRNTAIGEAAQGVALKAIFSGGSEGLQEATAGLLNDLVELGLKIDPDRNPLGPARRGEEFALGAILGVAMSGMERSDAIVLAKAKKAVNDFTIETATKVLDGSHPALASAQSVIDSEAASDKQKEEAKRLIEEWQGKAREALTEATASNAQLKEASVMLGEEAETEEAGRELTPFEKVGMGPEDQVALRDATDEEFAEHWQNELSTDEKRRLRGVLGVKDNANIKTIREAFREKTKDVTVEPDLTGMALPELVAHHEELSKSRGEAPSRVTLFKTSRELSEAIPEATPAAREAGASAVAKDVSPDDLQILGANWREREGQIERGAIAIVEGKTSPLVFAREKAQEWFRVANDSGTFTISELREARAEIEKFAGEADTHAETDEGLIEWASDYAVDYLAGKAPAAKSLPAKVREFFARLGEYMSEMVSRAIRLERAIKAGAVTPRFESALAQASGLEGGKYDPYAGLSAGEAADLGKMLADPAKADDYLAENDVSDSVVERFADSQRRGDGEGKIRGPLFTMGRPSAEWLREDAKRQGPWLLAKARELGYQTSEEFINGNFERFSELAAEWREANPFPNPRANDGGGAEGLRGDEGGGSGRGDVQGVNYTLGRKAKAPRVTRETLREHREELAELEREARKDRGTARPATEMARRLKLIEQVRTLERIVSAMPKELRGQMGGWAKLVKTGTPKKRAERLERATEKASRLLEKHAKNILLLDADKLFAIGKVRLDAKRRTKGFGPEVMAELANIEKVANMSGEAVAERLATLTVSVDTITDPEEHATASAEMLHLLRFGNLEGRNADELFQAVDDIRGLIEEGKLAWKAADETRLQEEADQRGRIIKGSIEGGQGWRDSSQGTTAEDEKGTLRRALENLGIGNLDWSYLLNRISRADTATGHMGSELVSWGTRLVHRATRVMERTQARAETELAEFLAGVSGIDTTKRRWKFQLKRAWAKFDEHQDTGIERLEIPAEARLKRDIPLVTARGLRSGAIKREEGGFTEGQERAILEALDDHDSAIAAAESSVAEAKAEHEAALTEGRSQEELVELLKIQRGQEAKLRGLRARKSLQGVDLTDLTKARMVPQRLSQSQAVRITMSYRQEDVRPIMEYHGYDERFMAELEAWLTPEAKALRDFLTEKYESGYDALNEVYRRIYGADLPKIRNYTPMSYFHANQKPGMEFGSDVQGGGSLSPGFTFSRLPTHRAEPNFEVGALATYTRHVAQQAHFIAFASPVRELRATLGHRDSQQAITRYYGKGLNKAVQDFLQYFADRGNKTARVVPIVDRLRRNTVFAGLAGNWTQIFKQPTGAFAYLYGIPAADFAKYQAEFLRNPRKAWAEMRKIPFVQERYEGGGERDIMAILSGSLDRKPGGEVEMPSRVSEALTAGMWFVRAGDLVSTVVGGYAAYRHGQETALRNGATEAEAHEEGVYALESMTELYQTGGNVKDMSPNEMGSSWERLFTTFLGNARKYYLATWEAVGDVQAGRADAKKELAKRIIIGHIILPALWQTAVASLKLLTGDDDDREEALNPRNWGVAMTLGPLSGIYVFGQFLDLGIRELWGVPAFSKPMPIVAEGQKLFREGRQLLEAAADGITVEDVAKFTNDLTRAVSRFTGGAALLYDAAARTMGSLGLDDNVDDALVATTKEGRAKLAADRAEETFEKTREPKEKKAEDSKEIRKLRGLGVASGARKAYMDELLKGLSDEEKRAKRAEWRRAGVL
jgi:hypothetical protein